MRFSEYLPTTRYYTYTKRPFINENTILYIGTLYVLTCTLSEDSATLNVINFHNTNGYYHIKVDSELKVFSNSRAYDVVSRYIQMK